MAELTDAASPGGAAGAAAAEEAGDGAGAARVVAAIEAAIGLAPGDPLEAMLITQMAAGHAAAMRCLGRAAECAGHPQTEALYLRLAARLMNLFVRQAEALDRRARRFQRTDARDQGSEAGAAEAAHAEGRAVLDKLLADIYARRKEEARGEARQRTEDAIPARKASEGQEDRESGTGGGDLPAPDP